MRLPGAPISLFPGEIGARSFFNCDTAIFLACVSNTPSILCNIADESGIGVGGAVCAANGSPITRASASKASADNGAGVGGFHTAGVPSA